MKRNTHTIDKSDAYLAKLAKQYPELARKKLSQPKKATNHNVKLSNYGSRS